MDPREPPYDRVVGRREIGTDGNAFVGRERELRVLQEELAETLSGRGRLVTIFGDAGIGKTRIIEEFVSRAADAPSRTLWADVPSMEVPRRIGRGSMRYASTSLDASRGVSPPISGRAPTS
jgi:hypothetical protein